MVRNYSIGDMVEVLGYDKYELLINLTVLDVKDIFSNATADDINKLKMYDIFCLIPDYNKLFIEFLNTFTYLEWTFDKVNGFTANEFVLDEVKCSGLMELVRKIYVVNTGKSNGSNLELNPDLATSEEARKLAEEFAEEEKKLKGKNKTNITLNGIIKGICSKSNNYNLFNIWDLTMYQLMVQYYGIEQDENYGYIMTSIYSGIYDIKKNKLNINDIHWASDIDV